MNRTADLPLPHVLGVTALAVLAAVGTMFILPVPVTRGVSAVALPGLTVLFVVGLYFTGQRVVEQARDDALRDAATDPETGLSTWAFAEKALALEFAAAQRGRPLTLVMLQIVDLPEYTAEHGRALTEQLLRKAGRTLRRHRRRMHTTAIQEAGTFVSILSGMQPEGAAVYAQRMRRELMAMQGVPAPTGVAAGIAGFDLSMGSAKELIGQARRGVAKGAEAGGKVVVVGQLSAASF